MVDHCLLTDTEMEGGQLSLQSERVLPPLNLSRLLKQPSAEPLFFLWAVSTLSLVL